MMERSFPPHLWRCLDTGPQRRGLSPSPPNTSPQAELSPDPGMKPALVWTPNAPFSFQASRHLPAGPDPAAGMKPLSSPSPPPRPSQCSLLPPWKGAHPSRHPHGPTETSTPLPAPQCPGGGEGGPQRGEWPPKFPGGELGAWKRAMRPGGARGASAPVRGWGSGWGLRGAGGAGSPARAATHLGGSAADTARAAARGPPGADTSCRRRRLPGRRARPRRACPAALPGSRGGGARGCAGPCAPPARGVRGARAAGVRGARGHVRAGAGTRRGGGQGREQAREHVPSVRTPPASAPV